MGYSAIKKEWIRNVDQYSGHKKALNWYHNWTTSQDIGRK